MFEGGFVTSGRHGCGTEGLLAEQCSGEDTAVVGLAFAALPGNATVVTLQRVYAVKRCHIRTVRGPRLNVPNEVFNNFERHYEGEGTKPMEDGKLAVLSVYGGDLELNSPQYRQIGMRGKEVVAPERGMLHCDEICVSL